MSGIGWFHLMLGRFWGWGESFCEIEWVIRAMRSRWNGYALLSGQLPGFVALGIAKCIYVPYVC
jgi:hypothetical protein